MQRNLRVLIGTAAAAGFLVASTLAANAVVFDFSGAGGQTLGTSQTFNADSLSVDVFGFEVLFSDDASYTAADLFQRNEADNDLGLGVCNSGDNGGACSAPGNGVTNEIDNNGGGSVYDVIRLNVADLVYTEIGLASLDGEDEANLFFSDSATPDLTNLDHQFADLNNPGGINPDITILNQFLGFDFIFITVDISDTGSARNDDFLLRSLTATQGANGAEVPEPMTLGLLGLGLAGLGLIRRRRKAA